MQNAEENIAQNAEQFGRNAERLLDTFGNAILRMAYSYLHNMSDAEEILQETLIRYLTVQPELQGPEHEKAWLLRVAANLSKNRLDYNRLRDTDELEETLVSQEREDLSFLWEAVKQLPDANREVIHLFYYEGYPTAQIAKILNRRESTVRSDLRRGRKRLKKILKEEYDFE
ncbi:sigma-70 family RNA polymerase sigma factor [Clostridium sp. AF27-2AA]|uniref:RNA polymerase sigma factor n=1 Tax=Clostridium sp. AF27-2AA TaxID=2292206 RepID=UPI00325BCBEE